MLVYYTGATVRLPIVSWERRFIDMAQSNDADQGVVEVGSGDGSAGQPEGAVSASGGEKDGSGGSGDGSAGQQPEGDDSESGGEEDGSIGSADGLHGMMLMSSTHHRYAGLFTIRKPGAPPVTQLLVRGSLA